MENKLFGLHTKILTILSDNPKTIFSAVFKSYPFFLICLNLGLMFFFFFFFCLTHQFLFFSLKYIGLHQFSQPFFNPFLLLKNCISPFFSLQPCLHVGLTGLYTINIKMLRHQCGGCCIHTFKLNQDMRIPSFPKALVF